MVSLMSFGYVTYACYTYEYLYAWYVIIYSLWATLVAHLHRLYTFISDTPRSIKLPYIAACSTFRMRANARGCKMQEYQPLASPSEGEPCTRYQYMDTSTWFRWCRSGTWRIICVLYVRVLVCLLIACHYIQHVSYPGSSSTSFISQALKTSNINMRIWAIAYSSSFENIRRWAIP